MTRERIGLPKDQRDCLCVESQEMGEIPKEYFSFVFTEKLMEAKYLRHGSLPKRRYGSFKAH